MTGTSGISICEHLEPRRLLSITLVDGVLKAIGTSGDDQMWLSPATRYSPIPLPFDRQIEVHLNSRISTFNLPEIRRIELRGRAGDDHIFVSNLLDLPLGLLIAAG